MKRFKSLIIFVFLLSFNSDTFGQNDYINYHLKVYQARKFKFECKPDSAVLLFKEAFRLVDFIDFETGACAWELADEIKDDSLKLFLNNWLKDYEKGDKINKAYQQIIDSLSIEDQRIREMKYPEALGIYTKYLKDSTLDRKSDEFIEACRLTMEWRKVDSSNIHTLLNLIKIYGFPGERLVGKESYLNAFFILLHFDRDTGNLILKPILDKALADGDIEPNGYAWIVDRRLIYGELYYYAIPWGVEKLSPKEIDEINKRRKAIGLRNLFEGVEIIRKANEVQVNKIY
jgi:hypothetical protein